MNKKNIRYQPKIINVDSSSTDIDTVVSQRMLQSIQQKLEKSSALNGGFDKLLYKIESIENSQSEISTKVDKIHEAIYHPDEGLFARITLNKVEQKNILSEVEKQIDELNSWKDNHKSSSNQIEKVNNENALKFEKLQNSIENLDKFKLAILGASKWIFAAIGGGLITLLFKVFYTFVILK